MHSVENSVNPKVRVLNGRAQLCQTGFLLSLSLIIAVPFITRSDAWWPLLILMASALIFLLGALVFCRRALEAYRSAKFSISSQRLKTLRATSTPKDILQYVTELHGRTFRGEGKFFRKMDRALGFERSAEWKSTIFKYSRVDWKPAAPTSERRGGDNDRREEDD